MYHFEVRVWVSGLDNVEHVSIIAESYDIGKTICDALYYADNVDDVRMFLVNDSNDSDKPTEELVYEMSDPDNDVISKILNNL